VLACGNPSRGDDALGPALIERLGMLCEGPSGLELDLLTEYQLQIEHVLDVQGRDLVVFVDAALDGCEPFDFGPVIPEPLATITTHAMTPGALLRVYGQVVGGRLPVCRLLAIRGYAFELGAGLTPGAEANLEAALEHIGKWLWSRNPSMSYDMHAARAPRHGL